MPFISHQTQRITFSEYNPDFTTGILHTVSSSEYEGKISQLKLIDDISRHLRFYFYRLNKYSLFLWVTSIQKLFIFILNIPKRKDGGPEWFGICITPADIIKQGF